MSVRASRRANKGENKYLQNLLKEEETEQLQPKKRVTKKTGSKKKSNKITEPEQEESVRCPVCNTNDGNYNEETDTHGDMIQCDGCDTWQHIRCMTDGKDSINSFLTEDGKYFCERCDPDRYPHIVKQEKKEPESEEEEDAIDDSIEAEEPYIDEENEDDDDAYIEEEHQPQTGDHDDHFVENDDIDGSSQRKKRRNNSTPINKVKGSKKRKSTSAEPAVKTPEVKEPIKVFTKDDRMRQNALKMFIDLFTKYIIPDTIDAETYSIPENETIESISNIRGKDLENALYEAWYDKEHNLLSKVYAEKVRNLFSNLKDKKNVTLKTHTVRKELPFDKLVKMSVTELANPDLQEFKEKIDIQSLDQVTIQRSDMPMYTKTHKGNEILEDTESYDDQVDVLYAKDNIKNRDISEDEDNIDDINTANASVYGVIKTAPGTKVPGPKETIAALSMPLKRVNIQYDEVGWDITGYLKFIGSTIDMDNKLYSDALVDGVLSVEGRLASDKAFDYLREVKSIRNVVAFQLTRPSNSESVNQINSMIDSLLMSDRLLGIKLKRHYEKNIYIMASKQDEVPSLFKELYGNNGSIMENIVQSEPSLFLLIVIKPELTAYAS